MCASRTRLEHHKQPWAHDVPHVKSLLEAVELLKPTILIGGCCVCEFCVGHVRTLRKHFVLCGTVVRGGCVPLCWEGLGRQSAWSECRQHELHTHRRMLWLVRGVTASMRVGARVPQEYICCARDVGGCCVQA